MKADRQFICLLAALGFATASHAESGPVFGGPIGATDIGNALLPGKPGLSASATEVFGRSERLYDNRGNRASGSSSADVSALYILYVYPVKLFGGTLASGAQLGYEYPGHVQIGKRTTPDEGFRDLYVDLFSWSKHFGPLFGASSNPDAVLTPKVPYGLTLKAQYSMIFPVGHYNTRDLATPGNNTYFFIPNAAAAYYTFPNRLGGPIELDAHVFLDARNKNPATRYENGNVVDIDYAVAQHIKNWTLGAAGSYTTQVSNDRKLGTIVSPNGDKLKLLTVGPLVAVTLPEYHVTFKVKAPFALAGRNTLGLSTVVVNTFISF